MDSVEYSRTLGYLEEANEELAMVKAMSDEELEAYAGDTRENAISYIESDIRMYEDILAKYEPKRSGWDVHMERLSLCYSQGLSY